LVCSGYGEQQATHAFPTRRSSDLRRDLPRRHQQREVPGNDLTGDTQRVGRVAVGRVAQLVGPTRVIEEVLRGEGNVEVARLADRDRKSTRLNSSHVKSSYAVFCFE